MLFSVNSVILILVFVVVKQAYSSHFISEENLDEDLQVKTENGIVQGILTKTENGFPYFSYRGIPYAKPPIKQLRFRSPKPIGNWKGVLDATKHRSGCIEARFRVLKDFVILSGSENCLFVNVYSPKKPNSKGKPLPVLVFIYGGAFIEGYSEFYGPDYLVEQDIIVVTFNYRIGVFGFLSTEDLEAPGNYGLKDQNLVLKWVKTNINHFGGDPNKITLSGQSAGAASTIYHFLSPKSRNLFHRAIAQSGTSLCTWSLRRNSREIAFQLGVHLGLETNSSKRLLSFLRSLDEHTLKYGQIIPIVVNIPTTFTHGTPFSPVIEPEHEDAFLSRSSYSIMKEGAFARVPIITGFNSQEFNLFRRYLRWLSLYAVLFDLSPGSLKRLHSSPIKSSIVGNKIMQHFFKSGSFTSATNDEFLTYFSNEFFERPAIKTIELFAKYMPVYFYKFVYEGKLGLSGSQGVYTKRTERGVAHTEELWYLWKVNGTDRSDKRDQVISKYFIRLWTNFIKTGNPTPQRENLLYNISWPAVSPSEDMKYLEIGTELNIKNNNMNDMIFWDKLYKNYSTYPIDTY